MNILVIGAGGVGASMASIAETRSFFAKFVLADISFARAEEAVALLDDRSKFVAEQVDARDKEAIKSLISRVQADVVVNACDPRLNEPIFDAAFESHCNYIDMAMNLSEPHASNPYEEVGSPLGKDQLAADEAWRERGLLALVGMGVEPGLSDVFARYAADNLFDTIDEIGVRDGSNLSIDGLDFAPTFSIWTTIEECLNPPLVWEDGRGWFTTEPFSELEVFDFPEGIGPVECVNVEHEEVVLIPQKVDAKKVNFKYGLGAQFITTLKTIHTLGLDRKETVEVQGHSVSPRDLLAASLPDPATLGERMRGKTCAGALVKGLDKSGKPYACYMYNVVDNEWSMANYGDQAVVWQTAINPVIAMELLHKGTWKPEGVNGPEWFDAKPFLDLLEEYGTSWHIRDESTAGISVAELTV
jgi:saccharopine dehydrogenase (NAD+, L-lysine forming)